MIRNLKQKVTNERYAVLYAFIIVFLALSFLVRLSLFIWNFNLTQASVFDVLRIFFTGLFFDIGVASFFVALYAIYLLLLPEKLNNSLFNKIFTYTGFFIAILITLFSLFAEFPFWQEFQSRFNFIAVDYLVYTFEVIDNINESYPLPILISGMIAVTFIIFFILKKLKVFKNSFTSRTTLMQRVVHTFLWLIIPVLYIFFVKNSSAEVSVNRYQNELSKAGIYSFVSAFRDNELNFDDFYLHNNTDSGFSIVCNYLKDSVTTPEQNNKSIYRYIQNSKQSDQALRPNVIMITIESFSAEFMNRYGSTKSITPFLDSLSNSCIAFDNLYATGTRTVRGMEALSLSIPPTPGNSIVRRLDNENLFTVSTIFKQKGYNCSFIYGGDGYFDNMNEYFGNNGFDIVDRSHNKYPGDKIQTTRTQIEDKDVHFENAWGICDEDLYDAAIRNADKESAAGKNFYQFIMTTSNHRPYTWPDGRIDIATGGRDGAVKYTDYAIRRFITQSQSKPWFKNTVFIIVADHCAESAGVNEIDISKYHIPCFIYNLPQKPEALKQLCSQIDIYPTLFSLINWNYYSNLFGKNVFSMKPEDERAFVSTYQKLGYLKGNNFAILNSKKDATMYRYNAKDQSQTPIALDNKLINETIAWYQSANYLYKSGGLKLSKLNGK